MRLRYIAAAVVGIGVLLFASGLAGGRSTDTPAVIDVNDGTIQVSASAAGLGSWVPYTVTVRNLGEQRFEGDMLLVNRPGPGTSVNAGLPPIAGAPAVPAPFTQTGRPVAPPDAAFQVHLVLDPRHKKVVTFTAPSNYSHAEVADTSGHLVAEVPISDRNALAVGVLSDTSDVADALAPLRFGELGLRTVAFDATHPLPAATLGYAGLVALVVDRTDSGRITATQARALRDFVGLGGMLVVAGSAGLPAALQGIPVDLIPLRPAGRAEASLARLADLAALPAPGLTPIATGTLAAGAQAVVVTADGVPLVAELKYGAGRIVELLYEPTDAALVRAGLGGIAWSNALVRGLERLPGNLPAGGTLLEPETIPAALLPKPGDAPLPSLLIVLGLGSLYILVVGPATYLGLRAARRPTLFWVAAPLLAVAFSLIAFAAGQGLQGGVREQQVEFQKLGPGGAVSTLSYHGVTFPVRGQHRIELAAGSLAAPLTLGYPALELTCKACPFQVAGVRSGVEEHVLPGSPAVVVETGVVYGSVRVVGEASTGSRPVTLEAHLGAVNDRITGTITNTGAEPLGGVRVYAFYGDSVRSASVAVSLAAGATVSVNAALTPVNDYAAPTSRIGLPAGVAAELTANAAAERALTRSGQVAVVAFVNLSRSTLKVDGEALPRQGKATLVETFGLESASGRLGNWSYARLNSTAPSGGAASGFLDTYDIEVPVIGAPPILRYDNRVYRAMEVFDWTTGAWRSTGFSDDPLSPLVKLTPTREGELRDGRVRVRVQEAALTWGRELVLRFADETP